jgi:soluble lytic murein transglycosylase-like protein
MLGDCGAFRTPEKTQGEASFSSYFPRRLCHALPAAFMRGKWLASAFPMRRRLLMLLCVTVISGAAAATVATARAGKQATAPRIPALPEIAMTGPACPIPDAYRSAFARASDDSRLPLAMLVAVAQVESHFQPEAVSHAGARGLLQVMPTTARSLELSADEPEANVLAGARYLRGLLDRFRSTDLALAAYNAGPTAVARLGGAPTRATVAYVANVTRIWRELNGCR